MMTMKAEQKQEQQLVEAYPRPYYCCAAAAAAVDSAVGSAASDWKWSRQKEVGLW